MIPSHSQLFVTGTIEGINQHLMDSNIGGGGDNPSWHGLAIAFHLVKQTKSTQTALEMLQDPHGTLTTSIHGTKQLRKIMEVHKLFTLVTLVVHSLQ